MEVRAGPRAGPRERGVPASMVALLTQAGTAALVPQGLAAELGAVAGELQARAVMAPMVLVGPQYIPAMVAAVTAGEARLPAAQAMTEPKMAAPVVRRQMGQPVAPLV